MVPTTLAMRVFAIASGLLSVSILWLLWDLLPEIDQSARDEPIRLPMAVIMVFVSAAMAIFAWRRAWIFRSSPGWAIGTIPAAIFSVAFLPVEAPILVMLGTTALVSGLVAFGETSSGRVVASSDVRDTRFRILGAIVLLATVGPTLFWLTRKAGRGPGSGGGGPGQGSGSGSTASPRTIVMPEVLAQGTHPLAPGMLSVSVLEIVQPPATRVVDMHDAGFVFVIEGEQQLTIDAKQQTVRSGSAAFVPPAASHEHQAGPASSCRWLFIGARASDVAERDFKFGQQSVVYRTGELPSLPAGMNTTTLSSFVLKLESDSLRYRTGGVTLFYVLTGAVRVDAGTGRWDLKAAQGTHVLSSTPFTLMNMAPSESRVLVFVLGPEGSTPLTPIP